MAVSRALGQYARRFNSQQTFWYFTKATAVKRETLDTIVRYHSVLMDEVISRGKTWNPGTQQAYANSVTGRQATPAWARELKVFFALLGTAWVEDDGFVKLTPVGRQLVAQSNPLTLLEQQVRKYQISNPSLPQDRTNDVRLVPHAILLELLLSLDPPKITRDEYVFFVSRIRTHDDFEHAKELLTAYRALIPSDRRSFRLLLDPSLVTTISRTFSYAADFLAFPSYLNYSPGSITIVDRPAAERILNWYKTGHDEWINFQTLKDWFSHYGDESASANSLAAADYYRILGRVQEAAAAYERAVAKGLASPEVAQSEYECRVQGEAVLEAWLASNLDRLENGLSLVKSQYETEDAGRIDILARDSQDIYVVIELKRDKASDVAIGQLLRYIGWVRLNLSQPLVRGYVIGDRFDDRIVYAILSFPAIDEMCRLREYEKLGVRLEITRSEEGCDAKVVEISS